SARRNPTRCNHAEICSAIAAMSKRFYPAFLIQPGGKGCAWGARYGNFQNRGAKAHALVDHQISKIKALRGEVSTKRPIGQRPAYYWGHEIKFFPGKGIHRLICTAMMLVIANEITGNTGAITVFRARC